MTKVGVTRAALVAGAFVTLEILCRVGTIPSATMIPPSEMLVALWQILKSGRANADIAFTILNTLAAIVVSVVLGFWLGALCTHFVRLSTVVS